MKQQLQEDILVIARDQGQGRGVRLWLERGNTGSLVMVCIAEYLDCGDGNARVHNH